MSDVWKSPAYRISLFIAALSTRALVGISHPSLSLEATIIVGLTTVLLLAPVLHRWIYAAPLLVNRRHQAGYALMTGILLLGFGRVILMG